MNQKHIFCLILLFFVASVDICMVQNLEENHGSRQEHTVLSDSGQALETLRAFELPLKGYPKISITSPGKTPVADVLAYLFCQSGEKSELKQWNRQEQNAEPKMYENCLQAVKTLLSDARYFPVPVSSNDEAATVSYENSWQYERTYGGTSGHEGCDIMADVQQRGYYPVISSSAGVVEKIGWLPKGGYRIGIRSPKGVYYYYAHLAEYEEGIVQGTQVKAGQLIGYMGDTGYSEIEGTTGNFPVHLHFGMYLNNAQGEEVSYNPYFLLRLLEKYRLTYEFTQPATSVSLRTRGTMDAGRYFSAVGTFCPDTGGTPYFSVDRAR